jgi:hypothetical protein
VPLPPTRASGPFECSMESSAVRARDSGTITAQTSINKVSIGIEPTSERERSDWRSGREQRIDCRAQDWKRCRRKQRDSLADQGRRRHCVGSDHRIAVFEGRAATVGDVTVFGDVLGGSGANSGEIFGHSPSSRSASKGPSSVPEARRRVP